MSAVAVLARNVLAQGVTLSFVVHATLIGAAYFFLIVHRPDMIHVELDLSLAPQQATFIKPAGKPRKRRATKKWVAPAAGMAPAPAASATEAFEEEVVDPCPPPCPDRPGDFVATALTKRPPRWVAGFIEDKDYPKIARKKGQDGKVVVRVFIDAVGAVRDVQLLEGSYPALNDVALQKVREAKFSPALDDSGNPVPAKLVLPIRFELY